MLKNRPIVVIALGYIIGIIVGLYCKISIVSFYAIFFLIYMICQKPHTKKQFKVLSLNRYIRYFKLIINKRILIIFMIVSILSNTIVLYKNKEYQKLQQEYDNKEISVYGKIVSNVKNTKYKKIYKLKVYRGDKLKYKLVNLSINEKSNIKIEFGNEIECQGVFVSPEVQRNYKGFDYSQYLKTFNIYGTLNATNININKKHNSILIAINSLYLNIKNNIKENFEKDVSGILIGMLLGETDEIEEDIRLNFSNSNISHLLAISGMHIGCLVLLCNCFKVLLGKRKTYLFTIIFLLDYIFIIGFHSSAVRAVIMAIMTLVAKIIYRKSDIWTNISFSILMLLIYNPFLIMNIGLILSYIGTIAIIIYSKYFRSQKKFYNICLISLAVYISILPIIAVSFNQIPILSFFIGSIIGIIITPIIILGFIYIIIRYIKFNFVIYLIKLILSNMIKILLKLASFGTNIIYNKIYVITPKFYEIILYYLILIVILLLYKVYHTKNKTAFIRRIRSLISIFKFIFNQNKKKFIFVSLIIIILIFSFKMLPKNLKIFFIDVGQGDSCLIVTPHNKKILIDGGGSTTDDYDVGKKVLIPYLLDRRIKKIDYIIISHFDSDHVGGILTVMEELKVRTVIIAKQVEDSENYSKFKEIVKNKKIKVQVVEQRNRIKIEKDLNIDILWPNNNNLVEENVLNNNSIVCKLNYKSFSMLFTGDIEEIAEKQILQEYKNNLKVLNSNILKVAHHGSKTSSTEEFIEAVNPKIALIGVGENNKFGHPSDNVLEKLGNIRYENI